MQNIGNFGQIAAEKSHSDNSLDRNTFPSPGVTAQSPIDSAINRLDALVSKLAGSVDNVEAKLGSVLSPAVKGEIGPSTQRATEASILHGALLSLGARIEAEIRRQQAIVDRITL